MTKKNLIAIIFLTSICSPLASYAGTEESSLTNAVMGLQATTDAVKSSGVIEVDSADCAPAPAGDENPLDRINFTQCKRDGTKRDDYLEAKIKAPYNDALKLIGNDVYSSDFSSISRCVNEGLNSAAVGTFYDCPNDRTRTKNIPKKIRPCPSRELVGAVSAEIMRAAHCLGRDYRKVLPIFMHESRFRPNVYSFSGAGGVGQMTGIAIEDVNRFTSQIRKIATESPECAYLADLKNMDHKYSCARTTIPPNPRQNIIYGIYYQTLIEDGDPRYSPRSLVNSLQAKRTRKLTRDEMDHLTEVLLHVSYNGGKGAALPSFQTLRDDPNSRNLPVNDLLKRYFALVKRKVGEEPATYHNDIVRDAQYMEKNSGANCTIY